MTEKLINKIDKGYNRNQITTFKKWKKNNYYIFNSHLKIFNITLKNVIDDWKVNFEWQSGEIVWVIFK